MTEATLEDLHINLAIKLKLPCNADGCAVAPTRIRMATNPVWGFEPGGTGKISEELGFLYGVHDELHEPGSYDTGISLDQIVAYCLSHFEATLPQAQREIPGQPDEPRTYKHTSRELADAAFEAYGRQCISCGSTDRDILQIVLAPGQPADLWARFGLRGWNAKYEFLKERGYDPKLCVVRCDTCVGKNLANLDTAAVRLRARVIDAYGGCCSRCGANPIGKSGHLSVADLWLVRKPGGQVLRYANGRKVSSKDKYRALANAGFPQTHELLCRKCWSQDRSGGGAGDPT